MDSAFATCGICSVGVYSWNLNDRTLCFDPQDKISITKDALSGNEEQVAFLSYVSTICMHDWLPNCATESTSSATDTDKPVAQQW